MAWIRHNFSVFLFQDVYPQLLFRYLNDKHIHFCVSHSVVEGKGNPSIYRFISILLPSREKNTRHRRNFNIRYEVASNEQTLLLRVTGTAAESPRQKIIGR